MPQSSEDGIRPVPSAWLSSEAGSEVRSILALGLGLDSSQLADRPRQTGSGLKRPQAASS